MNKVVFLTCTLMGALFAESAIRLPKVLETKITVRPTSLGSAGKGFIVAVSPSPWASTQSIFQITENGEKNDITSVTNGLYLKATNSNLIFVSGPQNGKIEGRIVDINDRHFNVFTLAAPIYASLLLDSHLVTISEDGEHSLITTYDKRGVGERKSIFSYAAKDLSIFSSGGNKGVLVEQATMGITPFEIMEDGSLRAGQRYSLQGAEANISRSNAGGGFNGGKAKLICGYTPGPNETSLFVLMPFRRKEGIRVAQFDRFGSELASFRLRENDSGVSLSIIGDPAHIVGLQDGFGFIGLDGIVRKFERIIGQ